MVKNELDIDKLKGLSVYMIGIKGTGMAALAELFVHWGANITGSDVEEEFYTDKLLEDLNINYHKGFKSGRIDSNIDLVIFSAAYNESNIELSEALSKNIKILEYTEALGAVSALFYSVGISGIHGKTTTTAICATLIKELKIPSAVLVGSVVSNLDNRCTYFGGDKAFIAETCELRRHFLRFHPSIVLITSIELDHLEYFKDIDDIESAFYEYCSNISNNGYLVYCYDDNLVRKLALRFAKDRPDINLVPYGFEAEGDYRITRNRKNESGLNSFYLAGWENHKFSVTIPGIHLVLDSAGAIAIANILHNKFFHRKIDDLLLSNSLLKFRGSKRRSEVLGEKDGVIFVDDYAHHPSAIETTLKGFKEFYPGRRIVVDFMPHLYSRTETLFNEFSQCFDSADFIVLNKIYSSAREKYNGGITGKNLFDSCAKRYENIFYIEEPEDAITFFKNELKEGDLFITMGAGNNWIIGDKIYNN